MPKLTKFSLPVPKGTQISSEYGERYIGSGHHYGIDFVVTTGTSITAAGSGNVTRVIDENPSLGKVVIVKHADDQVTLYAHLSKIDVIEDQQVTELTKLGESGSTGTASKGPHLHFDVIEGENYVKLIESSRGKPKIGIEGTLGRLNPRQFFDHYSDADFPTTVRIGASSHGLTTGDKRVNKIIANSNQNTLQGLEGFDTYSFDVMSAGDKIVDDSGRIFISEIEISGNAVPLIDSSDNTVVGAWRLKDYGLDLVQDGDDLVIVKSGNTDIGSKTASIRISNFPFENSHGAFGITLGKAIDLVPDENGDMVVAGYDSLEKSLDDNVTFNGGPFFKTFSSTGANAKETGFLGVLLQSTTGSSTGYRYRVGKFNSDGDQFGW